MGLEPATRALRMRCSTTELHRLVINVILISNVQRLLYQLSYIG
jgi:hypothetical protein